MPDHSSRHERLLKRQVASHRCPHCRHAFRQEQVRVAARHEDLWVVSVRCVACRKQQVYWIAPSDLPDDEIDGCDPTTEELERFEAMAAVTYDDVLDVHLFLAGFDGDFQGLFADRPGGG